MRVAINKEGNLYFLHTAPIDCKILPVFDIPDELYERWLKNTAEASQIQDDLKAIYESQIQRSEAER
ncbi:unnamed protein product [marine sediment metagenome]|uniref:Uncharacterized protein n=1 Tax=marine sediment metagenome TaxID=412755 RepID=X1UPA2_9ZZZZ